MRNLIALLPLLGVMLLPLPARAQDQRAKVVVSALEKAPDEGYYVTLQGWIDAPDGKSIYMRIVPLLYRLSPDDSALVVKPTEVGATSCSTDVQKGTFKTEIKASRLFEHEVVMTGAADVREGSLIKCTVNFFDGNLLRDGVEEEIKQFKENAATVEQFLSSVAAYTKQNQRVPVDLRKKLQRLETPVRFWAEKSDFTAGAEVITNVISRLYGIIPWDDEIKKPPLPQGPYGEPEVSDPNKLDVDALKNRLLFARKVAFHETLARILTCADQFLGAAEQGVGGQKEARGAAKGISEMFRALRSDDFGTFFKDLRSSKELGELIEEAEETLRRSAVPPSPEELKKLQDVRSRLKTAKAAALQIR